jgi:Fe-S-cluster-containing hydrogenase component 2
MGSKFVIADPGLCIGCQTCMAGCLLKHSAPGDVAKPRLNLITTLTISAPMRRAWPRARKGRCTSTRVAWR